MVDFTALLGRVADGDPLGIEETAAAFAAMASGAVEDVQVAGFLCALRAKGTTHTELSAAVREMRTRMVTVIAPVDAVDILGTGGDGKATYNISTAAAFVVASAGIPVAKQGNRAFSSSCGSADVLTAAGAVVDLSPRLVERCVAELGICFLFAPGHHPALRHVQKVRRKLGIRTIFNLMGPLMNAANVRRHLIGAYDRAWVRPMAETLADLGSERALVVSSASGMDEIALGAPTHLAELRDGRVTESTFDPRELGLTRRDEELRGNGLAENVAALRATLSGVPGAFYDATAVNAGAALYVAGRVPTISEGYLMAQRLLDDGSPGRLLKKYVELTISLSAGEG